MVEWDRSATAVEEAGASPARSRHCEPARPRAPGARNSRRRLLPPPGVDTRGEDAAPPCRRTRSPPSSAWTTCGSPCCSTPSPPRSAACWCAARRAPRSRPSCARWPRCCPPVAVVAGCRFSCDPAAPDPACPDGPHDRRRPPVTRPARLVELPVGATEDRLVGSLDLERALTEGVKAFEPGLLAAAHRGVLYVDEVNLLHDHLVDLLLDAAAMGTRLRRARRRLGAARGAVPAGRHDEPRGGRAAAAAARPVRADRRGAPRPASPAERAEVVRRRLAYDADPAGVRRARAPTTEARAGRAASPPPARGCRAVVLPRRRAAPDHRGLRGVRRRRAARRPRHRPRRGRARRLARARRGRPRTTSAPPPAWRCRTAAAATRSTRPAWTRSTLDAGAATTAAPTTTARADGPDGRRPRRRRRRARPAADAPAGPATPARRPDGTAAAPASRRRRRAGHGGEPTPAPAPRSDRAARRAGRAVPRPPAARCPASARARPAGGRGPAPSAAGSSARTRPDAAGHAGCTCPPRCSPPRRTSVARGRTGAGLRLRARRPARRPCARAARATSCCSASTPPARWRARPRMARGQGRRAVAAARRLPAPRQGRPGHLPRRRAPSWCCRRPRRSRPPPRGSTELPTGGRTPLAAGLLRAHEVLRGRAAARPAPPPLLVVVTDGRATGSRRSDPGRRCAAAGLLRRATASPPSSSTASPGRCGSGLAGALAALPRRRRALRARTSWRPTSLAGARSAPSREAACMPQGQVDDGAGRRADHPPAPQPAAARRAHRRDEGQVDRRLRAGAARLEPGLADRRCSSS